MSATPTPPNEKVKEANRAEGSIGNAFASLSNESKTLPSRFADLKKDLAGGREDALLQSWRRLLSHAERTVLPRIKAHGSSLVPEVEFSSIVANGGELPPAVCDALRACGTIVVRGVVDQAQALAWKQELCDYVLANPSTKGFPASDIQVYELYWSKAQLAARTHRNMLVVQVALNRAWRAEADDEVDLDIPVSYADRTRMRKPGDRSFNLGPHLDGGSLERWEDPEYRECYREIFDGQWEQHDAFHVKPRLKATYDMYEGPGGCSAFRSYQGWLSLSDCAPGAGTLRVVPDLTFSTAYTLLRPFVRPGDDVSGEDWVIDTASSQFAGAAMGAGQELNSTQHPHLTAGTAFVSVPRVAPGDAVFWHCDVAHMVEPEHAGDADSSVFYIPAAPLCETNALYLRRQREGFEAGTAPPDFPGGVGESQHVGRGDFHDLADGGMSMGFGRFEEGGTMGCGAARARAQANSILGL